MTSALQITGSFREIVNAADSFDDDNGIGVLRGAFDRFEQSTLQGEPFNIHLLGEQRYNYHIPILMKEISNQFSKFELEFAKRLEARFLTVVGTAEDSSQDDEFIKIGRQWSDFVKEKNRRVEQSIHEFRHRLLVNAIAQDICDQYANAPKSLAIYDCNFNPFFDKYEIPVSVGMRYQIISDAYQKIFRDLSSEATFKVPSSELRIGITARILHSVYCSVDSFHSIIGQIANNPSAITEESFSKVLDEFKKFVLNADLFAYIDSMHKNFSHEECLATIQKLTNLIHSSLGFVDGIDYPLDTAKMMMTKVDELMKDLFTFFRGAARKRFYPTLPPLRDDRKTNEV